MADGQAVEVKGTNPVSGGVINSIVGTGLGLATANYNDRRQERLNRKLQAQQLEAAKEMARFNQQMGLETWRETGPVGMRKQLQAAGLNVGLMYGQGGAGGTTQTAPGGYPGGGAQPVGNEVGMGIQSAMSMAMLQAQVENIKADTKLKETEAGKKAGVDTANVEASTANLVQRTENEKINNAILGWEEKIRHIEERVKDHTMSDAIKAIILANEETEQEIRSKKVEGNVKEGTQEELIKQINRASQEQALRIEAQKLGLIRANADIDQVRTATAKLLTEINNLVQGNMREWDKMSQKDKEIAIQKIIAENQKQMVDFQTSTPQQLKQWTELVTNIIPLGQGLKEARKIGF